MKSMQRKENENMKKHNQKEIVKRWKTQPKGNWNIEKHTVKGELGVWKNTQRKREWEHERSETMKNTTKGKLSAFKTHNQRGTENMKNNRRRIANIKNAQQKGNWDDDKHN